MRLAKYLWLILAALAPMGSLAVDVTASAPIDRSVTIYRSPDESSDESSPGEAVALDLDALDGFALVSETRTIDIPAGLSRIRFEGVADGIQPATALISGLPVDVVEKNEDAQVLSPSALVSASLGHSVELIRTNAKTGQVTRLPGVVRSDAEGGVVFQSAEGVEALRCSGLPETFSFNGATDLGASPTLSVLVRSARPTSAKVTLSYLSEGFSWMANYIATLSPNLKTMSIGAWVTLANGNAVSFPSARTQVVAGRLNREETSDEQAREQSDKGSRILATCWPTGTTSDVSVSSTAAFAPPAVQLAIAAPTRALMEEIVVTAQKRMEVQQEQLGDLKLYRVPEPTSVLSRQIKQVRLLDRVDVPVEIYYRADLGADDDQSWFPARKWLRTRNDPRHHLGLPLPSGQVAVFADADGESLLVDSTGIRDTALDEEVELQLGESPDVQVRAVVEENDVKQHSDKPPARLRRVRRFKSAKVSDVNRIEISNARGSAIQFELHLGLHDREQLTRAEPAPVTTAGRPLFKLTIPAGANATIRYQTEHTEQEIN